MNTPKTGWTALLAGLAFFLMVAMPASAKPTARPKVKPATGRATAMKPSSVHGPKSSPKIKTQGPTVKAKGPTVKAKGPTVKAKGQAVKPTKVTGPASNGAGKAKVKTTGSARNTNTDGRTAAADGVPSRQERFRPTDPVSPSKVQRLLEKNTNLRNKLASRLPSDMKVTNAAEGFRNLGQFVAAVNVSHNQGLDFLTLKDLMVTKQMSLGQAMQQMKVDAATADVAADRATRAALADLDGTTTTTTKAKRKGKS